MTRFLFVGDLQFGKGTGFGTPERPRLADQEEGWDWIVSFAIERNIPNVVLLGDVFEKRNPLPAEELAFLRPLRRARKEGIDVLAIAGNHDISSDTAASPLDVFSDLLDVHRTPEVWGRVATLPWTPPHRLAAAHGREQINERVAAHLIGCARELRLPVHPNISQPDILALHWAVSGASLPTGLTTDQLGEPVLPLEELTELGYKAIFCGHIHKAQVLSGLTKPFVVVAGSPMVGDFGEAEGDHGVWLYDTATDTLTHVPVPDRPFVSLVSPYFEQFRAALDDGRFPGPLVEPGAVVRVRFHATAEQAAKVDVAEIERVLYAAGAHRVHEIKPIIETVPRARAQGLDEAFDPMGALDEWIVSQGETLTQETARLLREATAGRLAAR